MIRREKIDKYETLAKAIEEKYSSSEMDCAISSDLLQETRDGMTAKFLEVVGMEKIREKQKHLEYITDITIIDSSINETGILTNLLNLNSLCLKSSCISNWNTVVDLLTQIPSLKILDLSENRISLPEMDLSQIGTLESLLLNNCGLDNWLDILRIAKLFPNLQTLSVKENNIIRLAESDPTVNFKNLKTLILNDNKISDFKEILKLSNLENLAELILINNKIEEIILPDCNYNEKLNIFPCLESLHIRDNPISDEMKSFNELDKLMQLRKISYISWSDKDNSGMTFAYVVGLIWDLQNFNRSELDKNKKNDAHYELWKRFAPEWIEVYDNAAEKLKFLNTHRVYEKLIEKYGSPEHLIIANKVKRATTIEVQFKNVANGKLYRKKLPLAMSIHTLYGLIYKLTNVGGYKMDSNSFKLYYVDAYNNNIKVYMDNLSKTLDFYSLHNGDTILIDY